MFSKSKIIASLERKLKKKDEEILHLKEMLGLRNSNCHCKSEFCLICNHFMGVVDSAFMCSKYDKAPCAEFTFNGSPLPNISNGFSNTELVNEYFLELNQKLS